jgi:hypothetical protein
MRRKLDYEDYEGEMAKSQLMKIENYARKLNEMIHPEDELEAWVQSKLSVIDAYMGDIKHYLDYQLKEMGEGGFDDDDDKYDDDDDDNDFIEAMEDAKEYVGEEKWQTFSDDEKIQVTKYLKMKGRVGYKKGGVTSSSSWGAVKYDADEIHINRKRTMDKYKKISDSTSENKFPEINRRK